MDVLEIMKYLVVVAWAYAAGWQFYDYIWLAKRKKSWRWVNFWLGIICTYWAGYYAYSIIRGIFDIDLGSTHQVWVRAPLLITGFLIAACASMSGMRHRRENGS